MKPISQYFPGGIDKNNKKVTADGAPAQFEPNTFKTLPVNQPTQWF
jgi:hypothetical protein